MIGLRGATSKYMALMEYILLDCFELKSFSPVFCTSYFRMRFPTTRYWWEHWKESSMNICLMQDHQEPRMFLKGGKEDHWMHKLKVRHLWYIRNLINASFNLQLIFLSHQLLEMICKCKNGLTTFSMYYSIKKRNNSES